MIYEFDLQADDYKAASLASMRTGRIVRAYVPYGLSVALVFWILLRVAVGAEEIAATAAAVILFLGFLGYYGLTWRSRFDRAFTRHYEGARGSILGPHTLELTDAGLNSSGPLHRSFRAWPSITRAVASRSHIFFHTLFGVVYVLPLRAVDKPGDLLATLQSRHAVQVVDVT